MKVVTGSADKSIKVFEVATGKDLLTLEGHGDAVRAVAVTKDGQKVVSGLGRQDGQGLEPGRRQAPRDLARLCRRRSPRWPSAPTARRCWSAWPTARRKVFDLSVDRPGQGRAAGDRRRRAGRSPRSRSCPTTRPCSSPRRTRRSRPGRSSSPGPSKNLAGHGSQVYSVAWSPDASKALTGSADASARLWDVAKGAQIKAMEKAHANVVYAVAWSPKGDLLATGGDDKLVKFWDPAEGKELRKGEGHGGAGLLPGLPARRRRARLGLGRQDHPPLERRRRQGGPEARRPPRRRLRPGLQPRRQEDRLGRLRREPADLGRRDAARP